MSQQATTQNTQSKAIVVSHRERVLAQQNAVMKAKENFAKLLPKHVTADALVRSVTAAISRTPELATCDTQSLVLAVASAAATGLIPNTPLQLGYLVPFRDNKSGKNLVQFIPSYRGLIRLATNSGEIKSIMAYVVYERDRLEVHMGTSPRIEHVVYVGNGGRGEAVGYYAVARLSNGESVFEIMDRDQVNRVAAMSKAKNGPWTEHFDEMARKTVARKLCKYLPMSEDRQLVAALQLQERQEAGDDKPIDDVIDVMGSEVVDEETGEVMQAEPQGRLQSVKARVAGAAQVIEQEAVGEK